MVEWVVSAAALVIGTILTIAVAIILGLYLMACLAVGSIVHLFVADSYSVPNGRIVLRVTATEWGFPGRAFLQVGSGVGVPDRFCLAGGLRTRTQIYEVSDGRVLLETRRDTFLIRPEPLRVGGPSAAATDVNGDCRPEVAEAPESARAAAKQRLDLTYVGAFDWRFGLWQFQPASVSPEQNLAPPFSAWQRGMFPFGEIDR